MYCIGSREQATRSGPLALGLGEVLTNPRRKKYHDVKCSYRSFGLGQIFWYDLSNGKGT